MLSAEKLTQSGLVITPELREEAFGKVSNRAKVLGNLLAKLFQGHACRSMLVAQGAEFKDTGPNPDSLLALPALCISDHTATIPK